MIEKSSSILKKKRKNIKKKSIPSGKRMKKMRIPLLKTMIPEKLPQFSLTRTLHSAEMPGAGLTGTCCPYMAQSLPCLGKRTSAVFKPAHFGNPVHQSGRDKNPVLAGLRRFGICPHCPAVRSRRHHRGAGKRASAEADSAGRNLPGECMSFSFFIEVLYNTMHGKGIKSRRNVKKMFFLR